MKGVVLAGGTGSRLFPLTKATNKHLLPIGQKPMIFYPIEKLVGAGIEEILIITGPEHMGAMASLLGSGKDFNCKFTYRVQDQAGGIAQALSLAEHFVHGDLCAVILGDNIFEDEMGSQVRIFQEQKRGARILLKEVSNPQEFGIAQLQEGRVVGIEEKPKKPKSSYAVTGIYFYDSTVFDVIKQLKPSSRGELEITDVNGAFLSRGNLTHGILRGYWSDAGTFKSLARVNQWLAIT